MRYHIRSKETNPYVKEVSYLADITTHYIWTTDRSEAMGVSESEAKKLLGHFGEHYESVEANEPEPKRHQCGCGAWIATCWTMCQECQNRR